MAAEQILLRYPLVQAVDVEIRKPQAPIGLPFESVSVKIHRGWHRVYIALGSNMGERFGYYIMNAVLAADGSLRRRGAGGLFKRCDGGTDIADTAGTAGVSA